MVVAARLNIGTVKVRVAAGDGKSLGVGVFPERQENLIGAVGSYGIALQPIGASEAEMRQRPDGSLPTMPR